MRRSPRMIPSRTVFNHCKWIYIELAITGAYSGMGPLCISRALTPVAVARANVFPISSLRTTNCNPSTPGIVPLHPSYLVAVPASFALLLFSLSLSSFSSLKHRILFTLIVTLALKVHLSFSLSPHPLPFSLSLSFSHFFSAICSLHLSLSFFSLFLWKPSLFLARSSLHPLDFMLPFFLSYLQACNVSLSLFLLAFSFHPSISSLFLGSAFFHVSSFSLAGFYPFESEPLVERVLVSVFHSRKTKRRLVSLDSDVSRRGSEIHVDLSSIPGTPGASELPCPTFSFPIYFLQYESSAREDV